MISLENARGVETQISSNWIQLTPSAIANASRPSIEQTRTRANLVQKTAQSASILLAFALLVSQTTTLLLQKAAS